MIKTGYIAELENLKKNNPDALFVKVCRPSILGPSDLLFAEFKQLEKNTGSRIKAWEESNYKERYIKEIKSNPRAIEMIKFLKLQSENRDVFLICYEKEPPCHRFVLKTIIDNSE